MATVPSVVEPVLSEERLERFAKRASQYDRDNKFFSEDFDELRDAGDVIRWRIIVPASAVLLHRSGQSVVKKRISRRGSHTPMRVRMCDHSYKR